MALVSIIVPVYKVEPYIKECLDSILEQTYKDFELILVDDGSPDQCPAICDAYALADDRIRVIHKENGGLSDARNAGIDAAQGDFLTFIDSDDMVAPEFLESLYALLVQYRADIAVCGILHFNDGTMVPGSTPGEIRIMSGREIVSKNTGGGYGAFRVETCGKLYRAQLFRELRFPVGRLHEDEGTTPILFYLADTVVADPGATLYGYRSRAESIMHTFSAKRFDAVWNLETVRRFFAEKGEKQLEEVCRNYRKILQARTVLQAYMHDAAGDIPREYKMTKIKALRTLRKYASDDYYTWYLAQIYPWLEKPHAYRNKWKRILGLMR